MPTSKTFPSLIRYVVATTLLASVAARAPAAIVNGDPLEVAIAAPIDSPEFKENKFDIFASDLYSYDDNVYRLSSVVTDLRTLTGIGPQATRSDRINTVTVGLDGVWNFGRQTITADLRVNDNRFDDNTNLDNVSNNDKLIWNWSIGSVLSGEVGAIYTNGLVSFVNSTDYSRDIYSSRNYYAAGRYQLGPHWALYGGILEADSTLGDSALRANDVNAKSVDFGTEYASGPNDSLGLEYRFTDATYPFETLFNNNYKEDAARFVVRHAFSDKTKINANVGFLKRDYVSDIIPSFSGYVWRFTGLWQPTEKISVDVEGYRNLQAYVTNQSDYYVSKGGRVAPQWQPTEKIALTFALGYEVQDYVGVGELNEASDLLDGSRRDKLATAQAGVTYTPFTFLILDFGYTYEKRQSNEILFAFNDYVISGKITVKY